ncbi:MAG: glucosylglycerol hydrolase, partial [Balneolaceae bacterium]
MAQLKLLEDQTNVLAAKIKEFYLLDGSFKASTKIVRHLGCHLKNDGVKFCIWHPEIEECKTVLLETYSPTEPIRFNQDEQHINFRVERVKLSTQGAFAFGVVDGLTAGNRDLFGSFYSFILLTESGEKRVNDPMAWSLPFGIYAPAEVYDVDSVLENRTDKEYFTEYLPEILDSETKRQPPSVNLLEIHIPTATHEGTMRGLSSLYRRIGNKYANIEDLSLYEKNFTGFDAVQLMPVEPVIQHPEYHQFWKPITTLNSTVDNVTVKLAKPTVINWGYDIVIFGSVAFNPSLLATGRPDEFLELIETFHNFPGGPIRVVLDIVFGHADNQAQNLLPDIFFTGPNMYGQDLNFQHPVIRAMLLEMQCRKLNWGVDALRVDGAQDFKYYDETKDALIHDDDFLNLMSEVSQEVCGIEYKPWMIFEDGRPWPREDWELASTYRDLIKQQDHCYQWAPMIFAYNTPYLFTFWMSKWWRVSETGVYGGRWISGYANHDTMRRGSQTDPSIIRV